MKFYIVDAFTDQVFGGNPAGVVILDKGASFPQDEVMRKTAAELRYSETAFVRQISEKEFNIRYFTPATEVDLCGHATIGSFVALLSEGLVNSGLSYINDTLAGRLYISIDDEYIMMDMGEPSSLGKIDKQESLEELYSVMGLNFKEASITTHIPELISTGLPDIMLPVQSRDDLAKINPDFPALSKLSERYNVVGVHAFVLGDKDITAYCRNFAPLYEINEECATGTSNGSLTYYLYKNGMIKEGQTNTFLQGEAMGRPSRIISKLTINENNIIAQNRDLKEEEKNNEIKIQVGGIGVILASGEIYI